MVQRRERPSDRDRLSPPSAAGLGPALPIMAVVFLSFMMIGMALPVLPLHVHDVLGFGPFVVGLVAGGQFVAALLSRYWAGRLADSRGPKLSMTLGLGSGTLGGVCYLVSLLLVGTPALSVASLIVGRALLGGGESLIITGGLLWGLGLVPPERSAKVIAWVGMAMFAALAIGAPLGSFVYAEAAFLEIAIATTVIPLLALGMILPLHALVPKAARRGGSRRFCAPSCFLGSGSRSVG